MRTSLALALACAFLAQAPGARAAGSADSSGTQVLSYPTVTQQAPGLPQAYALGQRSGTEAHPYFCLPGYSDDRGYMAVEAPGATPGSCTFKSERKRRDCDCGYYTYKDAHYVFFPGYGTSDQQTDVQNFSCRPYTWASGSNCDEYGRCYSYSYPFCE